MAEKRKELVVSAIENGTVIDHIPSKSVLQVMRILNLEGNKNQILYGMNLESAKYGKKGIIKIKETFFADEDINKISLVAPHATLITIKDYQVVEKRTVVKPQEIRKFMKCFNPKCITNFEDMETRFSVISKEEEPVKLRCHYCEKITKEKDMEFLK
ncbi:MAG: aspartate carbamoyltransferase regulatory subunit [Bacteroidales bacterium]|nr:aspartate carbamoyltransferase regulatory subunit [Bacteroidales bacterium]